MIPFEVKHLWQWLPSSPLHRKCRLDEVAGDHATDAALAFDATWYLWIYDLLDTLAFLDETQRRTLMIAMRPALYSYAPSVEDLLDHEHTRIAPEAPPVVLLSFADGKYVTWSGYTGFFELDTGHIITGYAPHPLESVAYNLTELAVRRGAAYREHQKEVAV